MSRRAPEASGRPAGRSKIHCPRKRWTAFGGSLALRKPPLCPEIALWLMAEDVDLEAQCAGLHAGASPPYWAFCWGSGQALARWILDRPDEVAGRRVVDFGAGSGIAGIAAARAGAAGVQAVDIDPAARMAVRANAEANDVLVQTAESVGGDWDLLLAGDVLYEPGPAQEIAGLCRTASGSDRRLVVSEPERPGNPGHPSPVIARYEVRTFPDVDSPTRAAGIYRLA